jgi:hypothetical protein
VGSDSWGQLEILEIDKMSTQLQTQTKAARRPYFTPVQTCFLERKCACGQHTVAGSECEDCSQKRQGILQRYAVSHAPANGNGVPPIVHEVLSSPGQALDGGARAFMEPRFGYDFSQVRMHSDARAAESARAVNAFAYTMGRNVAFGSGQYEPRTSEGRRLLAHELTHVMQQGHGVKGVRERLALHGPGNIAERDAEKTAFSIFRRIQNVAAYQHISGQIQRQQPGTAAIQLPSEEETGEEQQLPSGGVEEFAQNLGPPSTKITQGSGSSPAPSSLFYVSFQNVVPPTAPDHSQKYPGPGGALADRAGYTLAKVHKDMNIAWDIGSTRSGGLIPLFAKSVNIFYRLDPIQISVSSDYAAASCPYRVTLAHEQSHLSAYVLLFHAGRESLITALNRAVVPTQNAPVLVQPSNIKGQQEAIGSSLKQIVQTHATDLNTQMKKDKAAKDTPAAYDVEYAKCPANQWGRQEQLNEEAE